MNIYIYIYIYLKLGVKLNVLCLCKEVKTEFYLFGMDQGPISHNMVFTFSPNMSLFHREFMYKKCTSFKSLTFLRYHCTLYLT